MKQVEINAKGKSLGRVASEAALLLRGKDSPSFERHITPDNKVRVINTRLILVLGNKMKQKTYSRYSGYPGGLKKERMGELAERRGMKEVLRKAVYGMLPKNKLRRIMIKNLEVVE
jgi:large subunit ribosomal protein L13